MRLSTSLALSVVVVALLGSAHLWQGTHAQGTSGVHSRLCSRDVTVYNYDSSFKWYQFKATEQSQTTCCVGYRYKYQVAKCDDYCSNGCIVHGNCATKTTNPSQCPGCETPYNVESESDCEPVCPSACTNGYCSLPNLCTCDAGYHNAVHDGSNRVCVRSCASTDHNCECKSRNECACKSGYMFRASYSTCQPKCKNWYNGCNCRPEDCQCYTGYSRLDYHRQCIPVCPSGCANGGCNQPDECVCNAGYKKAQNDATNSICVPSCDSWNSNCNCRPEDCRCNTGYSRNGTNGPCKADCPDTCVNGNCLQTNICTCNEGYTENENGTCVPRCPESCSYGCTEPDICACAPGYERYNDANTKTCVPVCPPEANCTCTAPDVCECDAGYERKANETCTLCATEGCDIQTDGLSVVMLGSSIGAAVVVVLVIALLIILCRRKRREVKEDPDIPLEPNPEIDIRFSPPMLEEEEDNCLYGMYRLDNDGNTVGTQEEEFPSFADYETLEPVVVKPR